MLQIMHFELATYVTLARSASPHLNLRFPSHQRTVSSCDVTMVGRSDWGRNFREILSQYSENPATCDDVTARDHHVTILTCHFCPHFSKLNYIQEKNWRLPINMILVTKLRRVADKSTYFFGEEDLGVLGSLCTEESKERCFCRLALSLNEFDFAFLPLPLELVESKKENLKH